MNLVQRMVAENKQTVTSLELAEAGELSHSFIRQWLRDNCTHFERYGVIEHLDEYDVLNTSQTLLACMMYPSDSDKAWALNESAIDVVTTTIQASKHRPERKNT